MTSNFKVGGGGGVEKDPKKIGGWKSSDMVGREGTKIIKNRPTSFMDVS